MRTRISVSSPPCSRTAGNGRSFEKCDNMIDFASIGSNLAFFTKERKPIFAITYPKHIRAHKSELICNLHNFRIMDIMHDKLTNRNRQMSLYCRLRRTVRRIKLHELRSFGGRHGLHAPCNETVLAASYLYWVSRPLMGAAFDRARKAPANCQRMARGNQAHHAPAPFIILSGPTACRRRRN